MLTRTAVKWGVILGVAVCVWTLGVHFLGWYTTNLRMGLVADQVALVMPVVTLFLAIREFGRRMGAVPTFRQAEAVGLLAGLVSVPISAGFLWAYHHYINPRWIEYLVAHARQTGVDESTVARLQANSSDLAQLTGALVGTLIISALISFLSWGVLRLLARRARVNPGP